MKPVFLHTPITSADAVRAWLPAGGRPGVQESQTLDFKGMPWGHKTKAGREAGLEFAVDVAAMLNAEGGSLVIGVSEVEGGRAGGLSGLQGVDWRSARQQMEGWMDRHLDPRDAAAFVYLPSDPVNVDGAPVYAVEVAPFPFGPVAVWDGRTVLVPVRRGSDTRYLSLSEAARSMDTIARARYLELRSCWDKGEKAVRIDSGLFLQFADRDRAEPLVLPPRFAGATMVELTPGAVTLELIPANVRQALEVPVYARADEEADERVRRLGARDPSKMREEFSSEIVRPMLAVIANGTTEGQRFQIPLGEIRAVVRESGFAGAGPPGLLLHLKLVFHHSGQRGYWTMTT